MCATITRQLYLLRVVLWSHSFTIVELAADVAMRTKANPVAPHGQQARTSLRIVTICQAAVEATVDVDVDVVVVLGRFL